MAVNVELDPVFRQALRYLHSSSNDAAENIRKSLDEVIKQKHGPSKMLINTLSKKYLAEESKATGSGVVKSVAIRRSSSHKSSDSSSNNSNSSPVQIIATTTASSTTLLTATVDSTGQQQDVPVIISLPDSSSSGSIASIAAIDDNAIDNNMLLDNQHLKDLELEDLVCVVCRRIDLSAKNRLIECTKCNALYHQECHVPQIKDSDLTNGQESSWCCGTCKLRSFKQSDEKRYGKRRPSVEFVPNDLPAQDFSSSSSSSSTSGANVAAGSFGSSSSSSKKEREHSSSKSKSSSSSSSSSRHHSSHHHSSSKHERSSGSSSEKSSSSKGLTPHIHIISADKLKKKSTKSHDSKRKK